MIITFVKEASADQVQNAQQFLNSQGVSSRLMYLYGKAALMLYSRPSENALASLMMMPGIEKEVLPNKEYKLSSRDFKPQNTMFGIGGQCVGGNVVNVVAGPCSIESEEQIFIIAEFLHKLGVKFIRGGAYKPRTSPYRFQGLGHEGLKLIKKAADAYDLRVVTEIIDSSLIEEIYPYADVLQVGSRNMQNFFFLKQLGKIDKPILLKRGMYARIDEWLMAAEYILTEGNEQVILCERGIRTFDSSVRNTMDVAAIPLIKNLSHLPVWADPSHGTGRRDLITPVALASVAAGADGLVLEIHPDPQVALSDGPQSLYLPQFEDLINKAAPVAQAIGRVLDTHTKINHQVQPTNICVE